MKLYLVCAGEGRAAGHVGPAHPKIGEREVVTALLDHDHQLIRPGQVLLADKGFAGQVFEQHTADLGIRFLRPRPSRGGLPSWQPGAGSTADGVGQPDPEKPTQLGRSWRADLGRGVYRIAQRILALAAGIWHNWTIGRPDKRPLIAYDH